MHFDYKNDAPIAQGTENFMSRALLCLHRDTFMGAQAASLAVITDGSTRCDPQALYRLPASALPKYKRGMVRELRDAAGGYVCHRMFFSSLGGSGMIGERARARIRKSFSGCERFRYEFVQKAKASPGCGFLWIAEESMRRGGALHILFTPGNRLLPPNFLPLMCLDMWEHSYCVRYGADRGAYAAAFLGAARWELLER